MLPFRLRHTDRIVAGFLLAVVAAVAVALFLVVKSQGLFKKRFEFHTIFVDGGGIKPESPVRIAGIEVGSVRHVTLTADDHVEVVFDVLEEYADRVRADPTDGSCGRGDAVSVIDSEELKKSSEDAKKKCGSRVAASAPAGLGAFLPTTSGLIIRVGNRANPVIEPGGFIRAEEPEGIGDLIARLQKEGIVQNARDIVTQIDALLRQVNDVDGPIQKTLHNVAVFTGRAAEGKGLVGEITRDNSPTQKKVTAALDKLDRAITDLEGASANVATVTSGVAARNEDIQAFITKLESFSTQAENVGKDLAVFAKDAKEVPPDVSTAVTNLNGRIDELGQILRGLKRTFPLNMVVDEDKPAPPVPPK